MSALARETLANYSDRSARHLGDAIINSDDLLALFRSSYGDRYLGDDLFLQNYICRADKIASLDDGRELEAAALIRAQRLTAVATDPSHQEPGCRQKLMVNLLQSVQLIQPDSWITIHNTATKMQQAAERAGMAPLQDEVRMRERLHHFGELAMHTITVSPGGLIVTRTGSHHGAGYMQHAWGWQD